MDQIEQHRFHPAQTVSGRSVSTTPSAAPAGHALFHGDNLHSLTWMLENGYRGAVRLIYLDPPYDSGQQWTSRMRLRDGAGTQIGAQVAYSDVWESEHYLDFSAQRLHLLRQLLHPDGTIWLHCDHRRQAHLFLQLETIFGRDAYLNTVTWRSQVMRGAKVNARFLARSTQFIHVFAHSSKSRPHWTPPRREIEMTRAEAASRYQEDEGGFFRTSHPGTYRFETLVELHRQGRIYAPYGGEVVVDEKERRVYASNGGTIGVKYYVERRGRNRFVVTRGVDNLWDDIPGLGTIPGEDVNYPTQKTEGLLARIVEATTEPGDWVLDPFVGSGTTVVVANRLGRRWLGCDATWQAIRTTTGRLWREKQEANQKEDDEGLRPGGSGSDVVVYQGETVERKNRVGQVTLSVELAGKTLRLSITGFHSPVVAAVLRTAAVEKPGDWRALVEAVYLDPDYDGQLFRWHHVDTPAGRSAQVRGVYELAEAGINNGRCALRLVDICGHETTCVVDTGSLHAGGQR